MKRALFSLLFAMLSYSGALSQASSRMAQKPQKALLPPDVVQYFAGDWAGEGKFTTGKNIESDFSFVPELENQCVLVRQKEKPPNDFEFVALWSMDSVSGDLVMLLASNHDSGARVFRSQGWRQGQIVFQSVPDLRAYWAMERFTFERESPTTFHATYEMSMDNGKTWRVGDQQTFTKKSSQ
ncbi:MAG: hypothetical protein WB510_06655 [Candidatus Sulfotelmatobacter sp.]